MEPDELYTQLLPAAPECRLRSRRAGGSSAQRSLSKLSMQSHVQAPVSIGHWTDFADSHCTQGDVYRTHTVKTPAGAIDCDRCRCPAVDDSASGPEAQPWLQTDPQVAIET